MPKTYIINDKQAKELEAARKSITDKRIDKRLHAVQLRGEGMKNPAIAEKLDTAARVVSRWVCAYHRGGIEELLGKKRGGNRRNMSFAEEEALLEPFRKQAEAGRIIEVSELKAAYVEKVGHEIGGGQIYKVLERHKWRMVMPRPKHPKAADEATVEASKKLTPR